MTKRKCVVFVGSFVDPLKHRERGGMQVDCGYLMDSALAREIDFKPLDSTNPQLPLPPLYVRGLLAFRRFWIFLYYMSFRPDAVLIYSSGGLSAAEKGIMCVVAKVLGVPTVMSIRSGIFMEQVKRIPMFKALNLFLLSSSDCILCQGESWRDFYNQEYPSLRERILVLKNWIDPAPYSEFYRRRFAAQRGGVTRLLFVGWIKQAKGVFELVAAFRDAHRSVDIHLDIVGGGDDFQALAHAISESGLDSIVKMHGWQRGNALTQLYEKADIFILPTYAEGFPNVILEAMASGLPVITTPVGAIPDVVKDGVNGILIPPKDVNSLRSAIVKLANDVGLRHNMGYANIIDIDEYHTVKKLTTQLGVKIKELIRSHYVAI